MGGRGRERGSGDRRVEGERVVVVVVIVFFYWERGCRLLREREGRRNPNGFKIHFKLGLSLPTK